MTTLYLMTIVLVLLLLAILSLPLSYWLRLPYTSTLVIVGFVGSEIVVLLGGDTGVRAGSFHHLIFFVFLPILVFEAAFRINIQLLQENLLPILFLATVIMLASALLTGLGVYYGIAHPTGFPWIAACITGALLAATDPVAVIAQLKTLRVPKRLSILIEGESLFNDATAIVLFGLFVSIALAPTAEADIPGMVLRFLVVFFGGAAVGVAVGWVAALLIKAISDINTRIGITLLAAYGAFLIAEAGLHVSGIMATLVSGIMLARHCSRTLDSPSRQTLDVLWSVSGHLANAFVFLLMGITITVAMFQERWLAMLIAIGAVFVARLLSVYGGLVVIKPLLKQPLDTRYPPVIVWAGLRGSVALALAFSIPLELSYWWTIQSIAFGAVLFSIFVQAPTTAWLLARLGLAAGK